MSGGKTAHTFPHHPRFLIPVLVTGIQPDQVLGLERLFRAADAALLDPCDEHMRMERMQSPEKCPTAPRIL
jgi:hypothetical protein